MAIKPIKPSEITERKLEAIPDAVIDTFNHRIADQWNGVSATIYQDDLIGIIAAKLNIPKNDILDRKWLDVEDIYRKAGWKVIYNKPAYNDEIYRSHFVFTKK